MPNLFNWIAALLMASLLAIPSAALAQSGGVSSPSNQPPGPQSLERAPLAPPLATAPDTPTLTPDPPEPWVPTLHSAGLLLGQRVALSIMWPDAFDPTQFSRNTTQLQKSWSSPPSHDPDAAFFEWDGDPWPLNAVGHSLMGSDIYLRYRQHGFGPLTAFGATAAWSTTWEYTIEAWHKQPSATDLVWTPVSGLALGELRFWLYTKAQQTADPFRRRLLGYMIDPLGQLERDLLGVPY